PSRFLWKAVRAGPTRSQSANRLDTPDRTDRPPSAAPKAADGCSVHDLQPGPSPREPHAPPAPAHPRRPAPPADQRRGENATDALDGFGPRQHLQPELE